MKEIKFKAVLYKTNKVYDVIDISWISDTKVLVTLATDKDTGECFEFPVEGELIECTGLKDKNGKEIYSKDLLKNNKGQVYQVEWSITFACWQKWEQWGYPGKLKNLVEYVTDLSEDLKMIEMEVIGNLFENPELLKEIK